MIVKSFYNYLIENNSNIKTKEDILSVVNKYYAYHRSNSDSITTFNTLNDVEVVGNKTVKGYGVYFNFDKHIYDNKGKYLYYCALSIINPYITNDQLYSAIITPEKKAELDKNGFDSVVLVRKDEIVEIVVFDNSKISIEKIEELSPKVL